MPGLLQAVVLSVHCADQSWVDQELKRDGPVPYALPHGGGHVYPCSEHLIRTRRLVEPFVQDAIGRFPILGGVVHYEYTLSEAARGLLIPHGKLAELSRHGEFF